MATTTYSKITDIVEYLKTRGGRMDISIREIDGIRCSAYLDSIDFAERVQRGGERTEAYTKVRLDIEAYYQSRNIYHKCFERDATHEDIVAFLRIVPDLKYCKTNGLLCHDPAESKMYFERKFMEEIFESVDEVVNYKTDYGECPVCLDACYTILGCAHHLCLQCESKMKDTKCPQCREAYTRCPDDGDY
jgi:hypothetical protein